MLSFIHASYCSYGFCVFISYLICIYSLLFSFSWIFSSLSFRFSSSSLQICKCFISLVRFFFYYHVVLSFGLIRPSPHQLGTTFLHPFCGIFSHSTFSSHSKSSTSTTSSSPSVKLSYLYILFTVMEMVLQIYHIVIYMGYVTCTSTSYHYDRWNLQRNPVVIRNRSLWETLHHSQ